VLIDDPLTDAGMADIERMTVFDRYSGTQYQGRRKTRGDEEVGRREKNERGGDGNTVS